MRSSTGHMKRLCRFILNWRLSRHKMIEKQRTYRGVY
jgi:hypothetical protein